MIKFRSDILEELLTRKQLLKLGVLSSILGLVFLLLAVVFINNTIEAVSSSKDQQDNHVSQSVCIGSLRSVRGLNIRPEGSSIVVLSSKGLENAALKLGQASVASLICPGWELSSFCMGESCEGGEGVLLELQVID